MASVQVIKKILAHPDADRLELAEVGGFQAIVPKGGFKVGEKVIYIEPDNVLPTDPEKAAWAQPYLKYAAKRIRAIKIRGSWSEGLVIKITDLDQELLHRIQQDLDEKYLSVFQPEARNAIRVMNLALQKAKLHGESDEIKGIYEMDERAMMDSLMESAALWVNRRIDSHFRCLNDGDNSYSDIECEKFGVDPNCNSDTLELENAMLSIYGIDVPVFRKVFYGMISFPGYSVTNFLPRFLKKWRESCLLLSPGCEVSSYLGIVHYEPPTVDGGDMTGAVSKLPYDIPKTDEVRWEKNIRRMIFPMTVDITLKVDGQSWSCYYHLGDDKFGVLGRRLEFDLDVENNYTAHLARYDLESKLKEYCKTHGVSLCLRGESYGEGIQKLAHNPHSKMEKGLALFSVWMIDSLDSDGKRVVENRYARKGDPHYFINVAEKLGLPTVPILERDYEIGADYQDFYRKYANELKEVNGQSFEGVVLQWDSGSCKIINKLYDSKK